MSVRISATDWYAGGITGDDAVEIARAFKTAGADLIDVSTGQTSPDAKPVYGRMFQTPYADRIRNEVGIATMAVGNVTEADQVNAIIAAGRADLVALGRPHLADPAWTLHAAAKLRLRGCAVAGAVSPGKSATRALDRSRRRSSNQCHLTDTAILSGKHALVTGGARGIGARDRRTALAQHGARVSVVSRQPSAVDGDDVHRAGRRQRRRSGATGVCRVPQGERAGPDSREQLGHRRIPRRSRARRRHCSIASSRPI